MRYALAGLLLFTCMLTGCKARPSGGALQDDFGRLPDFTLTERRGRIVRLENLRGKIWVASFTFTRCGGACWQISETMGRLQASLAQEPDFLLVTISVDPDHDSPEVQDRYAEQMGADAERWLFLTGKKDDVYRLIRDGFRLTVFENEGPDRKPGFEVEHTPKVAVVDRRGHVRGYFDAHAFGSMDTVGFRRYLLAHLAEPGAPSIAVAEIDEWLYGRGMPATAPAVPAGVFDAVDRASRDWRAGRLATADLPVGGWVPQEWVRFLDNQPADLGHARMGELRAQFGLGAAGNAEIARSWLALVVRTAYAPSYADLERFLTSTGRYKLVVGLFRDLARTPDGLALGRRIYALARPGYHATIRQAVERLDRRQHRLDALDPLAKRVELLGRLADRTEFRTPIGENLTTARASFCFYTTREDIDQMKLTRGPGGEWWISRMVARPQK